MNIKLLKDTNNLCRFLAVTYGFFSVAVLTLQLTNEVKAAAHLDNMFGASGKVITKIGTYETVANDIAIQPDGKIVAVGTARNGGGSRFGSALFHGRSL